MKFLKKLTAISAVCLALIPLTACGAKTYGVYTNVPEGAYTLLDKKFVLRGGIGGYSAQESEYGQIDTAGYTAKEFNFFAMMSDAKINVAADFSADGAERSYNEIISEAGDVLRRIDSALSTSVANSDITRFNNAAAGEKLEITQISYEVLSEALTVYNFTEGYYNPALYYNVFAYYFGDKQYYPKSASQLPKDEDIEKYTQLASHFGETELTREGEQYFVRKPDYTVELNGEVLSMKLDLGGIGKGYAVDLIDGLFDKYGYKFGFFNFGTSSMLVKSNVEQGSYNIYFGRPRSTPGDALGYIMLNARNEKLSTSGDNHKFYILDGTRYCHIIDPTTGKPVQKGIMSASVIGGSAAEDDALTTAIMAMGKDKALTFIEQKLTDRRVVFTCE